MIRESFVLLPSVRYKTESKFWNQGVNSWDDFLSKDKIKGVGSARKSFFDSRLREASLHLKEGNEKFFLHNLPFSDQWRLYEEFKDESVYLDIETDGYYSGITVVGLSDGVECKTMVRGFNFDHRLLRKELSKYKLLVTFNGASFDMPVIYRYFGLRCNLPHVDLRFVCQKAGLNGGLKAIEEKLGIERREEVKGVCGEDAVYLWQMWKSTGDKEYLNKLVWYNEEDVLNLKPLAEKVIPSLWSSVRKV